MPQITPVARQRLTTILMCFVTDGAWEPDSDRVPKVAILTFASPAYVYGVWLFIEVDNPSHRLLHQSEGFLDSLLDSVFADRFSMLAASIIATIIGINNDVYDFEQVFVY